MNKSGKILFISPQLPYPLNVGSKIRIYNLLKSYSAKHEVTLICFTQNAEESEYLHNVRNVCTKVRGIPIETAYMRNQSPYKVGRVLSRLLAPLPFSIKSFVSPEMTTMSCTLKKYLWRRMLLGSLAEEKQKPTCLRYWT
jgi:hypothetical protein